MVRTQPPDDHSGHFRQVAALLLALRKVVADWKRTAISAAAAAAAAKASAGLSSVPGLSDDEVIQHT